jgi:enterochelin esterase-like enzyme
MKRVVVISIVFSIVTFFLSSSIAFCAGEVKHFQVQSELTIADRKTLSVYLPEDYNTSGASYPVLYLIHGSSGNSLTFLGGGYLGEMSDANVSVIVDRLVQEGRIKPLIVACPDVDGAVDSDEYLLRDIVPFVDATFRTIPNRETRAVAGHSMGGYQSLYSALAHSEVFSVVGGFSSSITRYRAAQFLEQARMNNQKLHPIRFWMYEGTNDEAGATQPNRDFARALKENGLPIEYVEDDGDHSNRVAQRLSEFIEFISKYLKR